MSIRLLTYNKISNKTISYHYHEKLSDHQIISEICTISVHFEWVRSHEIKTLF